MCKDSFMQFTFIYIPVINQSQLLRRRARKLRRSECMIISVFNVNGNRILKIKIYTHGTLLKNLNKSFKL